MSAGAKAGLSQSSCENSRAPWNKGIKNDNTVIAGRFHQLLIFGFLHLIHSQNEKRGKTQAYPLKNNLLGKKCSVLFVSLKLTFSCFCTSNRKGSKSIFLPGLFFLLCHLAAQEISTLLLNLRKRNEKNLFIFSPKVEWPHFFVVNADKKKGLHGVEVRVDGWVNKTSDSWVLKNKQTLTIDLWLWLHVCYYIILW